MTLRLKGAQSLWFMNVTDQREACSSGPQPITGPAAFKHHKPLYSFSGKKEYSPLKNSKLILFYNLKNKMRTFGLYQFL